MDNFIKYPKIYYVGHEETKAFFDNQDHEVIIQEKIDGANFRFMIKDGKIIFGSRTQQLTSDDGDDTNIAKGFKRCVDYIRDKLKDKDLSSCEGLIFFGEDCHMHTISYDWDKIPPFLGFDIYNMTENKFLSYYSVCKIYSELYLDVVPFIKQCKISELNGKINDDLVPISKYAKQSAQDMKAEGIVIKDYESQLFVKYVRDVFKEKNAEVFGGNPKYNPDELTHNSEWLFRYCTNARIEKIVFKLINDGNKLDMPLMALLPKQVYEDIWEEEWREIKDTRHTLDLEDLRKKIPLRCKSVLKQMIVNNSLR